MKTKCVLTLLTLVAGFSFAAEFPENLQTRRRPVEKQVVPLSQYRTDNQGSIEEKVAAGIEKIPQVVDTVSSMLEQAPKVAQQVMNVADQFAPTKSHIYFRMNVMEQNPRGVRSMIPGMGIGYRRSVGSSAIDFSASYSRENVEHKRSELITLPKVSYLYYLSPMQSQSLYLGPAIALGRIKSSLGSHFEGLIPSVSLGYEISRKTNLLSFFQFDMSLPLIAAKSRGPLPGLMAEFSFGAGF